MDQVLVGALLLVVLLALLACGVWIAIALAITGWVGQAFFTSTQPGNNLFTAFWGSGDSWELAASSARCRDLRPRRARRSPRWLCPS
jgi:hypothetical protein